MVIIPALNPSHYLIRLVTEIVSLVSPYIVIINDGSEKEHAYIFESLKSAGCVNLEHASNLGKGAALKTGLKYVLLYYPDACGIVTADADGQHSPKDIFRLA